MSIVTSLRRSLVPIHREGYPFILGLALASLLLGWLWSPLGWLGAGLTLWCALFFRDPPRVTPQAEGLVISPADGRIERLGHFTPPEELELGTGPRLCISVFMSVFDVHVNRAPVSGTVDLMAYRPGLFLNADLDKASEDNERNGLVMLTADGARIGVVQIAGLIARRIVTFAHVREGASLRVGERFGLIRFGSRVDVYLPEGYAPRVALGQTVVAGETILALRRGGEGSSAAAATPADDGPGPEGLGPVVRS